MQKKDIKLTFRSVVEGVEADETVRNLSAVIRLDNEMQRMVMNYDASASAFPVGEDRFNWLGTIEGPLNTVYAGHKYQLSLKFSATRYPFEPPVIKFVTPVFHPNVDSNGIIDLDILANKWSSEYDVGTILRKIRSLLVLPNIESPLNVLAAQLWTDHKKYKAHLDAFYEQNKDASN